MISYTVHWNHNALGRRTPLCPVITNCHVPTLNDKMMTCLAQMMPAKCETKINRLRI